MIFYLASVQDDSVYNGHVRVVAYCLRQFYCRLHALPNLRYKFYITSNLFPRKLPTTFTRVYMFEIAIVNWMFRDRVVYVHSYVFISVSCVSCSTLQMVPNMCKARQLNEKQLFNSPSSEVSTCIHDVLQKKE